MYVLFNPIYTSWQKQLNIGGTVSAVSEVLLNLSQRVNVCYVQKYKLKANSVRRCIWVEWSFNSSSITLSKIRLESRFHSREIYCYIFFHWDTKLPTPIDTSIINEFLKVTSFYNPQLIFSASFFHDMNRRFRE